MVAVTKPAKVRGTTFFIGGLTSVSAPASETTWTQIKGAKAIGGNIGTTWASTDVTTLTDVYKQEIKTIADAGSIDLGGNYLADGGSNTKDPGQAALQAAALDADDDDVYNFKAVQAGNGMITYFTGRVMSFETPFGTNANVREYKAKIKLVAALSEAAAA